MHRSASPPRSARRELHRDLMLLPLIALFTKHSICMLSCRLWQRKMRLLGLGPCTILLWHYVASSRMVQGAMVLRGSIFMSQC